MKHYQSLTYTTCHLPFFLRWNALIRWLTYVQSIKDILIFYSNRKHDPITSKPSWTIKLRMCAAQCICNIETRIISAPRWNLSNIIFITALLVLQLSIVTIDIFLLIFHSNKVSIRILESTSFVCGDGT